MSHILASRKCSVCKKKFDVVAADIQDIRTSSVDASLLNDLTDTEVAEIVRTCLKCDDENRFRTIDAERLNKRKTKETARERREARRSLPVGPKATPRRIVNPTLNDKEISVLRLLSNLAQDIAGGDFGILDEAKYGRLKITPFQFGAYVSLLNEKGMINVAERHRVNGEGPAIRQYTISKDGLAALKA